MSRITHALVRLIILFTPVMAWPAENNKQTLPVVEEFRAPDFTLPGDNGEIYRLADYRGKVVVLNFWATWCPPCRYEMPAMERAWQKVKGKGVVFLAVNVGENEDRIFQFTGDYPVTFPLLMDQKGEVVKKYPVIGLPTTYIIDTRGQVTHRAVGTREWDHDSIVRQLIRMRAR
jgi:peroxiredoxin